MNFNRQRPLPPLFFLCRAALAAALSYLRWHLRALGSDLVIRIGAVDFTLAAFCNMAGVTRIITQREVETNWIEALHGLSTRLEQQQQGGGGASSAPSSSSGRDASSAASIAISTWSAPIWPSEMFQLNYRSWKRSRGRALPPLPAPSLGQLPPLPAGIDPGKTREGGAATWQGVRGSCSLSHCSLQ